MVPPPQGVGVSLYAEKKCQSDRRPRTQRVPLTRLGCPKIPLLQAGPSEMVDALVQSMHAEPLLLLRSGVAQKAASPISYDGH